MLGTVRALIGAVQLTAAAERGAAELLVEMPCWSRCPTTRGAA
jgi:hypothetical protein